MNREKNYRPLIYSDPLLTAGRLILFVVLLLLHNFRAAAQAPDDVVGIIGITEETAPIIKLMTETEQRNIQGVTFIIGKYHSQKVVMARSGSGKVNAASAATLMIEHYHPQSLLFTGTAGGISPDLKPGDIVIGEDTAQHDFGEAGVGQFQPWLTRNPENGRRNPLFFPGDRRLLAAASRATVSTKFTPVPTPKGNRIPTVKKGVIVSGDVFISDSSRARQLRQIFQADAVEMEGAAVAQVCWQRGVPCLVIRSISDSADGYALASYEQFVKISSQNAALLVMATVDEWNHDKNTTSALNPGSGKALWTISFELAFGANTPYLKKYGDLTKLSDEPELAYHRCELITRDVLTDVVDLVIAETGGTKLNLFFGPGAWMDSNVQPSAHLQLRATEAEVMETALALGYLSQQGVVLASAPGGVEGGDRHALRITQTSGSKLSERLSLQSFWQRLRLVAPALDPGFAPSMEDGKPGLYIIDVETDSAWTSDERAVFPQKVAEVSNEFGITTDVTMFSVKYFEAENDWEKSSDGKEYLVNISGRGRKRLAWRLEHLYNAMVDGWIAAALRRHLPERSKTTPSKTSPKKLYDPLYKHKQK